MFNIKVLDCTLRDGGYVNNWDFGIDMSKEYFKNIQKVGIEYLEVGFLKDVQYDINKTLFDEIEQVNNILPADIKSGLTILAMIAYGNFDINKIVPKTSDIKLDGIRVTFKKHEIDVVFEDLKKIKEYGYQVFVNPTNINTYSDEELLDLMKKVNKLKPKCFSIVDTNGVLKENDVLRLFYLIDNNLDKNIALCFHSHNNLQLSFSNAQCLMKVCHNRELVIDSTVFGMGRGAGNLCTELLVQYLNDNYNAKYDIIPILKIVDEQINPIFAKTPWGYSVPYYLAAINHCHPNYAKYLVDKQTVPVESINSLLKSIPKAKKAIYDKDFIRQLYLDKFSNIVDDSAAIEKIKKAIKNKKVLLLAPGKTLTTEQVKIKNYIEKNNPYIISLNFVPKDYDENMVFVTNMKRFAFLKEYKGNLVVTSNIEIEDKKADIVNFSSYLNDSKEFDNTALMLLKLFMQIGIKEVDIAGMDGFSTNMSENYVSENLLNTTNYKELNDRNINIKKKIEQYRDKIKINFITKTIYSEK